MQSPRFSPSGLSPNAPTRSKHGPFGDAVLVTQKQYADSGAFSELPSNYQLFGDPALSLR